MLTSYDLCGPDPRPMTKEEVDAIKFIMRRFTHNTPIVVQVGAGIGVSTLAMLEARPDAVILSCDVGACEQEKENLEKAELDPRRVIRLLGKSQDIGVFWPCTEPFIDFLFIDGDHSEAGVRGDIVAWFDKVKIRGYVGFHDYIPEPIPQHIRGRVVYAVDDFKRRKDITEELWTQRLIVFQKV